MIKQWQSNHEYQCFLNNAKASFDSSERVRLHSELFAPWQELRLLDTDYAMHFLEPFYSDTSRPAPNQPQLLRSFILFFLLFSRGFVSSSLTRWVLRLRHDRVLAALIGCPCDSLPPLGSYFDFMDRLWAAPDSSLFKRGKLLPASWNRKRPQKPNGKGQKAPEASPAITEKIENRLIAGKDIPFNFEARLQKLFFTVAVLPSIEAELIHAGSLTVSGDALPSIPIQILWATAPRHQGLFPLILLILPSAPKHYSDPDVSWGWDSDLDKYYFGYTLFQLSCYNSQLHVDLPLLLRFTSARRHDSVNFLVAFHEFQKHLPGLHARDICLDSAMDNYPTYRLLKHNGIRAFIDLNSKSGHPKTIPDTITIDKNGTPVCSEGYRMVPNSYDKSRGQLMWRCPFVMGKVDHCDHKCSSSPYGRVIKTKPDWDIRLYTAVPRCTDT